MTTTINIDIDKLLQERADQIADLQLCLKETNILFTASTKRNNILVRAIEAHDEGTGLPSNLDKRLYMHVRKVGV